MGDAEGMSMQHHRARLTMWRSVAARAIIDSCREIIDRDRRESLDDAINYQMRYFNGRDWREVCECADIQCQPDKVEALMRSGNIRRSMLGFYEMFGFHAVKCGREAA